MFFAIDVTIGLRVPVEDEIVGLDMKYGGAAYNHEDYSDYGYSDSEKSVASKATAMYSVGSGGKKRRHKHRHYDDNGRRESVSVGL